MHSLSAHPAAGRVFCPLIVEPVQGGEYLSERTSDFEFWCHSAPSPVSAIGSYA